MDMTHLIGDLYTQKGEYKPKRDMNHSHLGSIGNLQLEAIRLKMNGLID